MRRGREGVGPRVPPTPLGKGSLRRGGWEFVTFVVNIPLGGSRPLEPVRLGGGTGLTSSSKRHQLRLWRKARLVWGERVNKKKTSSSSRPSLSIRYLVSLIPFTKIV